MPTDISKYHHERDKLACHVLRSGPFSPSERLVILSMQLLGLQVTATAILNLTQGAEEHIWRITAGLVRRGILNQDDQLTPSAGRSVKLYSLALIDVREDEVWQNGVLGERVMELPFPGITSETAKLEGAA